MPLPEFFGTRATNLPTNKDITVTQSAFNIAGVLAETSRKYAKAIDVRNPTEYTNIFGPHDSPLDYGPDVISGLFLNAGGSATVYVQSLIGYDTGTDEIDAVVASRQKADVGADADAYLIQAAYQDNLQYGANGNRIGTKITNTSRFETTATAVCPATAQSYAELASVSGMVAGDLILFKTNSGADLVYKKITQIDESQNRVYWDGNFEVSGGSGETLAVDDDVTIPGFRVQAFYKNQKGVEKEVEIDLGKIVCSSEPEVVQYYVSNIHASNSYIKVTEQSASDLGDRLPANDAAVVYPTNGADGTDVASVEAQDYFLRKFDDIPVRFIANPETTDIDMQKAIIDYCANRDDTPIAIINIQEDRTRDQLVTIGREFQGSDFIPAVIVATWLEKPDQFASSTIAPKRKVPNSGHVIGDTINAIQNYGIHTIPAVDALPLRGVSGIVGPNFNDEDRRIIAEAGINIIIEKKGVGVRIGNFFTPSTDDSYRFANGPIMRNFVKESSKDSRGGGEGTPTTIDRVQADATAIRDFMYGLWISGSTGNVKTGETFRQDIIDGKPTKFSDHVQVRGDERLNPKESLSIGKRNITVYFTFPATTVATEIGVGLAL